MSFYLGLWLVGFLFTLLRAVWTDLEGPGFLAVDLVAILTAYLFIHFSRRATAVFAFGQGYFLDVLSAGMQGLYVFLYLLVLFSVLLGSRFFNMQEPRGQVTVVALSVIVQKAVFLIILLLSGAVTLVPSWPWASLSSAVLTGLVAPVVFHGLNGVRLSVVGEEPSTSRQGLWEA